MDNTVEKEFTAYGGLFQQIICDLKNSAPLWEDFLLKATKFHSQLKATVGTSSSFLDAFQKIADMATNTRGATKEIGSALTRLCLRQKSVESKLKTFSNSLLESLIVPLQEKVEEWKKMSSHLDKDHAKECKRAKQELKKKSSDTLRLQKKVKKVGVVDMRRTLDYALQDVTDMYLLLEETEKQSIRKAFIEERTHFCIFVGYLQPVLESEVKMLNEINHLEEVIDTLLKITCDPHVLPETSEQVILDMKNSGNTWLFTSPPGSPGSLGSRKSSVCSISSANSSSSGSLKGHHHRSFCQLPTFSEPKSATFSTPSSPLPSVTSTWPNLQESDPYEQPPTPPVKYQRPHTISSAYEKNSHNRPALTTRTFEPLDCAVDPRIAYATVGTFKAKKLKNQMGNYSQPGTPVYSRPSIPERNEDICKIKPFVPEKSHSVRSKTHKSMPDFNRTPADQVIPHPVYANTNDIGAKIENVSTAGDSKELQSRRELANVLTEGLLLQSRKPRSENSPYAEIAPKPKPSPSLIGISDTLPRSRGVAETFHVSRKANTLQRVGSITGNKPPPTPVRRSSSITAPSNTANGSMSMRNNGSSYSISSGAGEACYSPGFREPPKEHNTILDCVANRGRSFSPLRHVRKDHNTAYENIPSPSNGLDSDSEKGIVTDVSDSRARLIQDLNSTLLNKTTSRKQPNQNDIPTVPPRHSSRQEQWESRRDRHFESDQLQSPMSNKMEKRNQTFIAKPVLCQDISKNLQRKPSFQNYNDSTNDNLSPPQFVPQRNEEKQYKHNFMLTLNAKLAQHQQNSYIDSDKPSVHSAFQRESLMDQIKRGTTLRRVRCNDRSVPRLA